MLWRVCFLTILMLTLTLSPASAQSNQCVATSAATAHSWILQEANPNSTLYVGLEGFAVSDDADTQAVRTVLVPLTPFSNFPCPITAVTLALGDKDVTIGTATGKDLAVHRIAYSDTAWINAIQNNGMSWNTFYDTVDGPIDWGTGGGDYLFNPVVTYTITSETTTDTIDITTLWDWNDARNWRPIILKFDDDSVTVDPTQIIYNTVVIAFDFDVPPTPTPFPTPTNTPNLDLLANPTLYGLNSTAAALEDKLGLDVIIWKAIMSLAVIIGGLIVFGRHPILQMTWVIGIVGILLFINFFPIYIRILLAVAVVGALVMLAQSRKGGYDAT